MYPKYSTDVIYGKYLSLVHPEKILPLKSMATHLIIPALLEWKRTP